MGSFCQSDSSEDALEVRREGPYAHDGPKMPVSFLEPWLRPQPEGDIKESLWRAVNSAELEALFGLSLKHIVLLVIRFMNALLYLNVFS